MNNHAKRQRNYTLTSKETQILRGMFNEIRIYYAGDMSNARIIQFVRNNPFKFCTVTYDNGICKAVNPDKEDVEQALYNAGHLVIQTVSDAVKEKRDNYPSLEDTDKNKEAIAAYSAKIEKENIIIVILCVFATMFLGYFVLLYYSATKRKLGVVLK